MKKIECLISDEISETINELIKGYNQTRAEFARSAIIAHIDNKLVWNPSFDSKIKQYLKKKTI